MVRIRKILMSVLMTILVLAGIIGGMIGLDKFVNHSESMTTHTSSTQFKTKAEKLRFLKRYLIAGSPVLDAEYRIDYWDNSSDGLSGPSDWDIRVIYKVARNSVPDWVKGFQEVSSREIDPIWWSGLGTNSGQWATSSVPKYYKRKGIKSYMVVYEAEGIIYKIATTK